MADRRVKGGSSDRFPLLGLSNHCGWWLQPWNQKSIASWKEIYDKLRQCVENQRHYSADKGRYSQGYVFPVDCESWTVQKAEHQRMNAFELWCWRRLLKVPWTARRSNQSILREINPEYSLGGPVLKLKLQCFDHQMRTADSLEMSLLRAEGEEGHQRMRWLDGIPDAMDMNFGKTSGDGEGQGGLACCSPQGCKDSDTIGQLNNKYLFWSSQHIPPPPAHYHCMSK